MIKKDIVQLLKKRVIYRDISEATLNKKTKKDLENLLNQDEPLDFDQLTTQTHTISGSTYSQVHYDEYNRTGDKNIFEEVIDKMMLDGYAIELRDKIMSMSLKDKRMAILSLLDKDRKLFTEIKSLIGDVRITKMEHTKDIISMLRAYVKVGEVEKKAFGEVMTDLNLVKHIISKIPKEDFSNPDIKFLDPANGTGVFPLFILYRLMVGLKDIIVDEEARYKHIVENQIYVSEIQPKNMFLYMCLVDPYDEYKLNIYTGSSLEEGFSKHRKDVWKVDNFNYCIGNPPFNQMIDMIFVQQMYTVSDVVLFVHPSTWLLDEKGKQKKFRDTKDLISQHLDNIELFNGNGVFGISLFVPCVITYIDKNKKSKGITCFDRINNTKLVYDNISNINKFSDVDVYFDLKHKIKSLSNKNLLNSKNIKGDFFVNVAQIRGHVKDTNKFDTGMDNTMLVNDFYTLCTKDQAVTEESKQQPFAFKTELEANNFLAYIKTDIVRFCLAIYKNNGNLHRGELGLIPWLDFSRKWTDEDLIKEFNLTEDEVEFINKNIPKYY